MCVFVCAHATVVEHLDKWAVVSVSVYATAVTNI